MNFNIYRLELPHQAGDAVRAPSPTPFISSTRTERFPQVSPDGRKVAFISDRNDGAANLFLYDSQTHAVRQLTHETQWDVRNAGAYERTIVFEAGGLLRRMP